MSLSCIDQEWIAKIRNTQKKASARFVATIVRSEENNVVVEALDDLPFELTSASLNDACDSVFVLRGYSDGAASAVIDLSEFTNADKTNYCNKAVAPTADPEKKS